MSNIKNMSQVLALSYILMMFANPALGISVSHETNGVSSSASYHLDTSATLKDVSKLGESTISRTGQLSGSGNNEYSYQTSANSASVNGAGQSSGTLSATISTVASAEGSLLSQGVDGSGDLSAAISGSAGSVAAGQNAGVANGAISTSQSVATGGDVVVAGQDTQLIGDDCRMSSDAIGSENHMEVLGEGYSGYGGSAELLATAEKRACISGMISNNNLALLDTDVLQEVASTEDIGMQGTQIIYDATNDGVASFNVAASNMNNALISLGATAPTIPADKDSTSGTSNYAFMGYKWNKGINFVVDTSNRGYGVSGSDFGTALSNAANTWKCADSKIPSISFQSGIVSSSWKRNSKNEIGWYSMGAGNLAGTVTWNSIGTQINKPSGRYSPATWADESDVYFNSRPDTSTPANSQWTKNSRTNPRVAPFDVQATAVHEFGHVLGLQHVTRDTNEIMAQANIRSTSRGRTLGNGDIAGIKLLYP